MRSWKQSNCLYVCLCVSACPFVMLELTEKMEGKKKKKEKYTASERVRSSLFPFPFVLSQLRHFSMRFWIIDFSLFLPFQCTSRNTSRSISKRRQHAYNINARAQCLRCAITWSTDGIHTHTLTQAHRHKIWVHINRSPLIWIWVCVSAI